MRFPSHFPSLITVVPAFLIAYVRAQSWNYSHYEYTTEEIPLWTAVVETEKNGYWDLGFGRSIKALVYELGGCSKGHPCAVGSGLPWGYPVGCNPDKCVARWLGDPWSNYNFLCQEMYDPDNTFLSDYLQGNATALTNEYFDYFDPTCILRYDPTTNLWTLENTGVAIVMKTQGFKLPAQTVIVSDIDTIDIYDAAAWPDIMQEANINFALNDGNLLKPTNTYAADRYPPSELTRTPDVLDPINVTLSQAYLDSLNLGISETWVMGTIAGLSSDKIGDCNHFKMPEFYAQVAGCSVWAEINTEFDSMLPAPTFSS